MTDAVTRPIRCLLIANRGEIVSRVARTARAMGIRTVAVYAATDVGAPFVADCDQAMGLRGERATETYLDADQLLAAARAAGADAVHPGYGFLSERADFAEAVVAAGLTWVGPPPAAIAAMGDKLEAKCLMAAAGVPVLASQPIGDDGRVPEPGTWPVLVKAAAGGGGKGMRLVTRPADLAGAVASAQREAAAAFGDSTVFVERYLTGARHVEIQILADEHGHVVHCFERECSIQRRHQKIIEEAPSPALDDALRRRMTDAAVTAAATVGYRNAGTVEFVLGPDGDFAFLEVNTRLQVEHPVTEAITGVDLVREQLRIAQGLPVSFLQDDLRITGHAIEARLYAEDPATGFLPATGTLVDWQPPVEPAVRWDAGVAAGTTVSVEWDPMLAKVIAHAPTRQEAAGALALALERARIRGVTTNRDYLVAALRHPALLAGTATTAFVDTAGVPTRRVPDPQELEVAAVLGALAAEDRRRASAMVLRGLPSGWRNSAMPPESVAYHHEGTPVTVTYRAARDGVFAGTVAVGDDEARPFLATTRGWAAGSFRAEIDGRHHAAAILDDGHRCWVQTASGDVALVIVPRFPPAAAGAVPGALAAPMPGRVLAVPVVAGAVVVAGDPLVVVEAMKMEHRVSAPHDGTVIEIRVAAGDQVAAGDLLVVVDDGTGST